MCCTYVCVPQLQVESFIHNLDFPGQAPREMDHWNNAAYVCSTQSHNNQDNSYRVQM